MKFDPEKLAKDVGAAVRATRLEAGLTQSETAANSGLRRQHLVAIEGEGRNITLESLGKLACALKLKPSQLLSRARW